MDMINTTALGNIIQKNEKNINNLYDRVLNNASNASKKEEVIFKKIKIKNSQQQININKTNSKDIRREKNYINEINSQNEIINADNRFSQEIEQLKLLNEIQSQMQLLQTEFINEQNTNIQEQVINFIKNMQYIQSLQTDFQVSEIKKLKKLYYDELDNNYKLSLQNNLKVNLDIDNRNAIINDNIINKNNKDKSNEINVSHENNNNTQMNIYYYNNDKAKKINYKNDNINKNCRNVELRNDNNINVLQKLSNKENEKKKDTNTLYSKYINQKASFIPIYVNKNSLKIKKSTKKLYDKVNLVKYYEKKNDNKVNNNFNIYKDKDMQIPIKDEKNVSNYNISLSIKKQNDNNLNYENNINIESVYDKDSNDMDNTTISTSKEVRQKKKIKKFNYSFAKKVILELQSIRVKIENDEYIENDIFKDESSIVLQDFTEDDSTFNHLLDPKRIHDLIENDIINPSQLPIKLSKKSDNKLHKLTDKPKNVIEKNNKYKNNKNFILNKKLKINKNNIKKTIIHKAPMSYRDEINKFSLENENKTETPFYKPILYSEEEYYKNNINNDYDNGIYNILHNNNFNNYSGILQSPQPRPYIECPRPSIPDIKPINVNDISITKEIQTPTYLDYLDKDKINKKETNRNTKESGIQTCQYIESIMPLCNENNQNSQLSILKLNNMIIDQTCNPISNLIADNVINDVNSNNNNNSSVSDKRSNNNDKAKQFNNNCNVKKQNTTNVDSNENNNCQISFSSTDNKINNNFSAIINKLKKNNATKILKSQYYQKEKENFKKILIEQQNNEAFEINNEIKKVIINSINNNINKTLNNNSTSSRMKNNINEKVDNEFKENKEINIINDKNANINSINDDNNSQFEIILNNGKNKNDDNVITENIQLKSETSINKNEKLIKDDNNILKENCEIIKGENINNPSKKEHNEDKINNNNTKEDPEKTNLSKDDKRCEF
ncbi:hypothetical protein BCR36DRAFT_366560 [Piromyces finnis]|uniref:Uncharacterized protein n=1 Tax=Piromyces finnis TaxID=1754191 RepID=A0A1Y1VJS0_9FUNG|nr:hypothetical protein BCR36DRAFT_366560 [Piromyces finnis]|eukprot:ORX58343.1 hypothetical protein BCR36DRAFT_366560 [Piromyces finnis]